MAKGATTVEVADILSSSYEFVAGIPANNPIFWDGSRYWLFYEEAGTLRARYGNSLSSMQATPVETEGGSAVSDVKSKRYAMVFGTLDGRWHAWGLCNRASGEPFAVYRWHLSEQGLAEPASRLVSISSKFGHASLMPSCAGFEVSRLFGVINDKGTASSAARMLLSTLEADTGLRGVVFSNALYGETEVVFQLTDGYIYDAINVGDWTDASQAEENGNFSEWKRPSVESPWGPENHLEQSGEGVWADANYGRHTSHAGQTDFIQTADGVVYNAYIDNFDTVNGNFGRIRLRERGASLADPWVTVSLNVIPDEGKAWHLSLASDGDDIWVLYVKALAAVPGEGTRDSALYMRRYDRAQRTFDPEFRIAQTKNEFLRMATQWRFYNGVLTVVWSEAAGGTYYLRAAAVAVDGVGQMGATSDRAAQPNPSRGDEHSAKGSYTLQGRQMAAESGQSEVRGKPCVRLFY